MSLLQFLNGEEQYLWINKLCGIDCNLYIRVCDCVDCGSMLVMKHKKHDYILDQIPLTRFIDVNRPYEQGLEEIMKYISKLTYDEETGCIHSNTQIDKNLYIYKVAKRLKTDNIQIKDYLSECLCCKNLTSRIFHGYIGSCTKRMYCCLKCESTFERDACPMCNENRFEDDDEEYEDEDDQENENQENHDNENDDKNNTS